MGRFLLFFCLLLAPLPAGAFGLIQRQGNVAFANVTPEEYKTNVEWLTDFNAKIELAAENGGAFPGAYVRVFNGWGILVFKHFCEKPWLLLKLPDVVVEKGEHHVVAVDRKKRSATKPFRIREGSLATVKLKLARVRPETRPASETRPAPETRPLPATQPAPETAPESRPVSETTPAPATQPVPATVPESTPAPETKPARRKKR